MLNVLSNFIPDGERLITIEESAELQIQGAHVVTLETRPANAEGTGEIRIRDLVRNSLRMRPDRIIVGECRGSETLDMLQAMNTGHAGSMTTVHANTPRELLGRLETMVMMGGVELPQRAIREQIVMAVGVLVQLQRTAAGPRVVTPSPRSRAWRATPSCSRTSSTGWTQSEGMGRLVPTGPAPEDPRRAGAERHRGAPAHLPQRRATASWRPARPGAGDTTARRGRVGSWSRPRRRSTRSWPAAATAGGERRRCSAHAAERPGRGVRGRRPRRCGAGPGRRGRHHAGADEAAHAGPDPRRHHGHGQGAGRGRERVPRARRAVGADGPDLGLFGRIDTSGALERRLERAAIPLRSGEYIVITAAIAMMLAVVVGVMAARPSARSSPCSWWPPSPGTCRPGGPPSGSSRCRSNCPTRWR